MRDREVDALLLALEYHGLSSKEIAGMVIEAGGECTYHTVLNAKHRGHLRGDKLIPLRRAAEERYEGLMELGKRLLDAIPPAYLTNIWDRTGWITATRKGDDGLQDN